MRSMPPNKCRKIHRPVQFTGLSLILAVLFLFAACAFAQDKPFPCEKGLLPVYTKPSFLPDENSIVFNNIVQKIKDDFEKTKSFSNFNFAGLIPRHIVEELKIAMDQHKAMLLQTGIVLKTDPLGIPFYVDYANKPVASPFGAAELMKIEAIISWFERLILAAFPNLVLKEATSQLRVTKERGLGHSGLRAWHNDGSPISVLIAFDGPGPDVSLEREGPPSMFAEIAKVTEGEAIVFADTCIHRSPNWNGKRFLMIVHFYSK